MAKCQVVGYVRVSSVDQHVERQLDGVQLDRVFTDRASGKDTNRPELTAALAFVREGDTLLVHSMDRLARNTEDLLRTVRQLNERGVTVTFVKERLSFSGSSDAMAELMMTVLAGIAKFERALIRERQREGIALAKRAGKYKGRKKAFNPLQVKELREKAAQGIGKAELARLFRVSRQTVHQYLRDDDATQPNR